MSATATEPEKSACCGGAGHGDPAHACACNADAVDLAFVDQLVAKVGREPQNLINLLQGIQEHYRWLPPPALEKLCVLTGIPASRVVGVATFYRQFRHRPMGRHLIKVCVGTACHVKGAPALTAAYRDTLKLLPGQDTDASGEYTVSEVACLGCCTLAPVVQVDSITYGHVKPGEVPAQLADFKRVLAERGQGGEDAAMGEMPGPAVDHPEVRVGLGSCCMVKGSDRILHEVQHAVQVTGTDAVVRRVGCVGMCYQTPMVEVAIPGQKPTVYARVTPDEAAAIVHRHFGQSPAARLRTWFDGLFTRALDGVEPTSIERHALHVRDPATNAFAGPQVRIATEGFGLMDPLGLAEYEERGGFQALRRMLREGKPEVLIAEVEASGLRGRGGAGFPTGTKWKFGRAAKGDEKYVICNGDEGDPGAFMDRMLLESFPYRIIEGLALAAWAIGAHRGVFYIRAEYPLAVLRMREALKVCAERGYLGDNCFGSGYALHFKIKEGAGAFVCGEETALIESVEGKRGMPRVRPPFPVERGLHDHPTMVNNVETLGCIPWIVRHGGPAFAAYGTTTSKGTKVFALAGKVVRGGLIEVPMGVTIRQIVEEIGGGVAPGRKFKAVQIGGPSGGCIPARLADTPVDYQALTGLGAIMGSGGLVVLDDCDCMVDIARYFMTFTQDEACGQCAPGRIGTRRLLDILTRLCNGEGKASDLAELDTLSTLVKNASLCQLCKTAPNPVLTTLKYFREEYEAHIQGRCPAGKCQKLIRYEIDDTCNGCTRCSQVCPVNAIPVKPYRRHVIDASLCTKCDACRTACPIGAVHITSRGRDAKTDH